MGLPALYAAPQNQEDWQAWSFNHAALHYDLIGAVAEQKKQNLTQYCLNPISDVGFFLYQHQIMHNQANAVLGTVGNNLLDYDLSDPDELAIWLNLNGSEHQAWNPLTGVG
jgi:hypothetical protein